MHRLYHQCKSFQSESFLFSLESFCHMEVSELALFWGDETSVGNFFPLLVHRSVFTLKTKQSKRYVVFEIPGSTQDVLWQWLCCQPWEQPPYCASLDPPERCKDCDLGFGPFMTKKLAEGRARVKPHLLHRKCEHKRIRVSLPLCQNSWNFYETTFEVMAGWRVKYPSKEPIGEWTPTKTVS